MENFIGGTMRNLTDERAPRDVREDDERVVRARPGFGWTLQHDWRGGTYRPRRGAGARRPGRAGIVVAGLLGAGVIAVVALYAADYIAPPELNETPPTADSDWSVDPHYGTVAVPAHVGPVLPAEPAGPSNTAPVSAADSDAPGAADASEPDSASEDVPEPAGASAPPSTAEGSIETPDVDTSQPGAAPNARGAFTPEVQAPAPAERSGDPDAHRSTTPKGLEPNRSSREGAPSVPEWSSDNPY
jgi:hypothetical protein